MLKCANLSGPENQSYFSSPPFFPATDRDLPSMEKKGHGRPMATTLLFMVKLISWEPRVKLFGSTSHF